jgi:hypothetical protein
VIDRLCSCLVNDADRLPEWRVQRLVVIVQLRGRRAALARPARDASREFEHAHVPRAAPRSGASTV